MIKEQYAQMDQNLLSRWSKFVLPGQSIIWDGIIDYEKWISHDLKLAFILREAYDKNGESWNIAEAYNESNGLFYVGNNANQSTHNRIVEWAYAMDRVLHSKPRIPWNQNLRNTDEARNIMLSSAYLNVKKIDGKFQTYLPNLQVVGRRDKALLKEQIDLINPNVIICCGTFSEILREVLFDSAVKLSEASRCYEQDNRLIIDFHHPTRTATNSYDWLIDDVEKITNKSRFLR